MAFNIQTATDYVVANAGPLKVKMVYGSPTSEALLASTYEGIKHKEKIGTLIPNLTTVAGNCGWNPSGSMILDEVELEVTSFQTSQSLCMSDWDGTINQIRKRRGNIGDESIPDETLWVDSIVDNVKKTIEEKMWMESTTSSPAGLFDGYVKLITLANGAIDGGVLAANASAAQVLAHVQAQYALIPTDIYMQDDLVIFMSDSNFRKLQVGLMAANLFHYDPAITGAGQTSFMIPGLNLRAINAMGLNSAVTYTGSLSNFLKGVDDLTDESTVKIWYEAKDDSVLFRVKYKLGVNVLFTDQIVVSRIA